MISLIGAPFVPVPHGATAPMDWTLVAGLIVVMAVALVALLMLARRSAKPRQSSRREPTDSRSKAA
jgi:hypothetical protein